MHKRILFLTIVVGITVAMSIYAREWTSRKGSKLEAEFVRQQGQYVILRKESGKQTRIKLSALSDEDQAYVKEQTAPKKTEKKDAAEVDEAQGPTEAEFMDVIKKKCFRCHRKACGSLADLEKSRWVKPGNAKRSPTYRVLGKHKKKNGTYHDVSDEEKKIIHDFIENYKG